MKKIITLLMAVILSFIMLTSCKNSTDGIEDGTYTIAAELSGGSGRAFVKSPMTIKVQRGLVTATVIWSSKNYDFMLIGGEYYYPINEEGNSTFQIPIENLEEPLELKAETVAMSKPQQIDYSIAFDTSTITKVDKDTQAMNLEEEEMATGIEEQAVIWQTEIQDLDVSDEEKLAYQSTTELSYATKFRIDNYQGGYSLLSVIDGSRYLVVPKNQPVPKKLQSDVVILQQPVSNIYIAATSTMSLFDALDGLSSVKLSGIKASDWYNESARKEMEAGSILYAGKYSEPDYELLLSNTCSLAIESTMINHTPEVKEKLEEVGITVFTDCSSYEEHPLGRTEWIKAYAVVLGEESLAEDEYLKQVAYMNEVISDTGGQAGGERVAFFYISSSGYAVTRKPGDYVSKMIELAGGTYIFKDIGEDEAMSSTILEMEKFYDTAKDADFIIYNGTIDGGISSVDELIEKNHLLADLKAVKEGNVWCTNQNLYQETTKLGQVILEMHQIFSGKESKNLNYFYHIE
ncbi:MAG: ABC transporter substrate-binding protein [Velocimicrobium sp.]